MKRILCVLILSILLPACARTPKTEASVTETGATETPHAAMPIEQALDCFISFHEMAKTDVQEAIKIYSHYESQEHYELAMKHCYRTASVDVLRIQQLSEELWVVESFVKGVETMVSGYYGVDYIGIIDGEYKIMFAEREIPKAMKEGVEIEPYEEHGPGIVNPEDILSGSGDFVIG